ncbi:collagen alpha-4(IV) chain-like isoform X1 [Motacilla alba alba]|uniref:collagen alpha-4(IV) chain-like isoform X1 n=1 Tax=Motacilla alba alba TaxID=1094192 RepID=UPI0018D51413|nr:collagen alpha-4(IV) chain-like isoform X1 [Motacilla alba alba]
MGGLQPGLSPSLASPGTTDHPWLLRDGHRTSPRWDSPRFKARRGQTPGLRGDPSLGICHPWGHGQPQTGGLRGGVSLINAKEKGKIPKPSPGMSRDNGGAPGRSCTWSPAPPMGAPVPPRHEGDTEQGRGEKSMAHSPPTPAPERCPRLGEPGLPAPSARRCSPCQPAIPGVPSAGHLQCQPFPVLPVPASPSRCSQCRPFAVPALPGAPSASHLQCQPFPVLPVPAVFSASRAPCSPCRCSRCSRCSRCWPFLLLPGPGVPGALLAAIAALPAPPSSVLLSWPHVPSAPQCPQASCPRLRPASFAAHGATPGSRGDAVTSVPERRGRGEEPPGARRGLCPSRPPVPGAGGGRGWRVRLRDVLWPGWEGVRAHGAGGSMAVSGGPGVTGGSAHGGDNEGSAGTRARPVRVSLAPGGPDGNNSTNKNKNIFPFKKTKQNQSKQTNKQTKKKKQRKKKTPNGRGLCIWSRNVKSNAPPGQPELRGGDGNSGPVPRDSPAPLPAGRPCHGGDFRR